MIIGDAVFNSMHGSGLVQDNPSPGMVTVKFGPNIHTLRESVLRPVSTIKPAPEPVASRGRERYDGNPIIADRKPFTEWLLSLPNDEVFVLAEGTSKAIEQLDDLPKEWCKVQENKFGLELRVQFPNPPASLPLPSEVKRQRCVNGYRL